VKEKLTEVWKSCETKQLAKIFEDYMKSIGVRKRDGKRKDNSNSYMIDGKSTAWNRVQCYYHKDNEKYASEDLLIVLRKRSGDYLIIERLSKRAFEVDYHGVITYDESRLKEIIDEHKPLFDALIALTA
jgi:hypothetical protein